MKYTFVAIKENKNGVIKTEQLKIAAFLCDDKPIICNNRQEASIIKELASRLLNCKIHTILHKENETQGIDFSGDSCIDEN